MKLAILILLSATIAHAGSPKAKTYQDQQNEILAYEAQDVKIAVLACRPPLNAEIVNEDECEKLRHLQALDRMATKIEAVASKQIRADFDRTHKNTYFSGMESAHAALNCDDIRKGLSKANCAVDGGNDGYAAEMKVEILSLSPLKYRVIYDHSSTLSPSN